MPMAPPTSEPSRWAGTHQRNLPTQDEPWQDPTCNSEYNPDQDWGGHGIPVRAVGQADGQTLYWIRHGRDHSYC